MKKIAIISVAFQRLIRNLIHKEMLDVLTSRGYDILIVSPFSENKSFQKEFGSKNIFFLEWKVPSKLSFFGRISFFFFETLRVNGFWFRHRRKGMKAYLANNSLQYGKDGADVKFSRLRKASMFILSFIGSLNQNWKIIKLITSYNVFRSKKLDDFVEGYDQILLIQSANWGMQDHMLSWNRGRKNWKSIMIPYTIDQLFANGYLLSNYDYICVQGHNEKLYAKQLHGISNKKIIELGSSWFTNMGNIIKQNGILKEKSNKKTVLYTGCSNLYFHSESEYQGLEFILKIVESGRMGDLKVIYRPLGESEERKEEIIRRFSSCNNLEIQFAQRTCFGLEDYDSQDQENQLMQHIQQIINADIVVMCFATSIAHDAAYLGVPSVINLVDKSEILERRLIYNQLDNQGHFRLFEGIPVAHDYETLAKTIEILLSNVEESRLQVANTVRRWHYPEHNFADKLKDIL